MMSCGNFFFVPYVGPGCICESSYVRRCIYAFLLEVNIASM
jgi:hypothetical protein